MSYFHLKFYLQVTECLTYANTYTFLVKRGEAIPKSHYGEKQTGSVKFLNTLNTYCLDGYGLLKLRLAQNNSRMSQC